MSLVIKHGVSCDCCHPFGENRILRKGEVILDHNGTVVASGVGIDHKVPEIKFKDKLNDFSDYEKLTTVLRDIGVEFEIYKEDCVFTKQTIGHVIVIKSDTDTINFSFKLGDKFMSLS